MKTARPALVTMFNYYRDAEMHGASLLFAMARRDTDEREIVSLDRHLADETRHAAMWARRIIELGGKPSRVSDGYQARLRREIGLPRSPAQLYALTLVAEERAQARYEEHLGWADPDTAGVLDEVMGDERWHLSWVKGQLERVAETAGQDVVASALARFREADRKVSEGMMQEERALFADAGPRWSGKGSLA